MKPTFKICRYGAQTRSINYDEMLNDSILRNICFRLTQQRDFKVEWKEERNTGRLVILETDRDIFYITLSPYGVVRSRNSYFQSVPTAFGLYLNSTTSTSPKKRTFAFYFLPCEGDNQTKYMKFFYRLLCTIGTRFVNPDYGIPGLVLAPFCTAKEIITRRNDISSGNSQNNSTYITNEGKCYHIYGKTFGANQKETTMLCMAINKVADKPVKLFQIIDNESTALSANDMKAIITFSELYKTQPFTILDDTYIFTENEDDEESTNIETPKEENLRDPKFIYNLLVKSNGHKCCALCDCEIDSIIQGAHIYPVSAIKKRNDLTYEQKLSLATDKDNGIWLCENHHKLFDRGLLHFVFRHVNFSQALSDKAIAYLNEITTKSQLDTKICTPRMDEFLAMRDTVYRDIY